MPGTAKITNIEEMLIGRDPAIYFKVRVQAYIKINSVHVIYFL